MNIREAIEFHVAFTIRMMKYCKKPDGQLDPDVIIKPDICALGQWIEQEKHRHANVLLFEELKTSHIVFHQAAAMVVRKANAGFDAASDVEIGGTGPFAKASQVMTDLLVRVQEEFGD